MNSALQLAVRMVAATLMGEAGGEPVSGMEAVAQVIAVRMEERRKDAVSICIERRQFCCWNRGTKPMFLRIKAWEAKDTPKWQKAKEMALRIVQGVYPAGEKRFNHFYDPERCKPAWRHELKDETRIGKHIFGRIE